MKQRADNAFTLVELSIVLVILGLLVGGVLAGQSLIRAAELRSVATDSTRNLTAFYAFREKYMALPGDITNATAFWGAADADPATCAAKQTATVEPGTCNGDGSGFIADGYTVGDVRDQFYEGYRAWQQLALAGLIEGNYVGNSVDNGQAGNAAHPGVNTPISKIGDGASWTIRSFVRPYTGDWFSMPASNYIVLGNNEITAEGIGPVLSPAEAWNIDSKLDDGKPGLGQIRTMRGNGSLNPGCTLTGADNTDYALDAEGTLCSFNFLMK